MPKWALVIRTYEQQRNGTWKIVLEHRFFGATQAEAQGYYESHLKTDSFLRSCLTGRWQDVTCYNEAHWERL